MLWTEIDDLLESGELTISAIYPLIRCSIELSTVRVPPKTNGFSKFRSTPWGSGVIAGRRNIFGVASL